MPKIVDHKFSLTTQSTMLLHHVCNSFKIVNIFFLKNITKIDSKLGDNGGKTRVNELYCGLHVHCNTKLTT